MDFEIPQEYYYTESHEWIAAHNGSYRVGITDFAQDELGDIVFVELPAENDVLEADTTFGVIESIKAVSDIYAPVGGTVVAVNDRVQDEPDLVNKDPFGEGWLLALDPNDELEPATLLSSSEYENYIE